MTMLKEMRRVLKPGGILAVAAWSSEKLLPGYPRLEARLGATAPGIAPFHAGRDPALHFQHGLGWFRKLGLENFPKIDSPYVTDKQRDVFRAQMAFLGYTLADPTVVAMLKEKYEELE